MNIIEHAYAWNYAPSKRSKTRNLILHHAAAYECSPEDIHRWHRANGWAGIGYHFLVRKDGSIHRGRPIDTIGAHTGDYNSDSIGVCFEGNFENETMCEAQKNAGAELVSYIRNMFPDIKKVTKHKDYNATACPGKHFPFDEIAAGKAVEETPKQPEVNAETEPYLVRITASELNVRDGAGTNFKVNTTVEKNEIYTIVDEKNGWGKLKSGAGWIYLGYTELYEKASYLVEITASELNVRSGPGTNFKVNTAVKKGEVYTIVEENGGWGKLKSGAGWIYLGYTKKLK